jgi:alpha-mannosidase
VQLEFVSCGYKTSNTPPESGWQPFEKGQRISGRDDHFWFRSFFRTPPKQEGKSLRLSVRTGREGQWDALNPQGLVFLNGKTVQALDTNHTEVALEFDTNCELYIYFYVGMLEGAVDFTPA